MTSALRPGPQGGHDERSSVADGGLPLAGLPGPQL